MDDRELIETTVSTEAIYNGKILNVERMTVTLPNGKPAFREVIRHVGAAAVVPVDDEGYVYLVRQFRAPMGRIMLEIPAGKLDSKNEDRLNAAKRELSEETGLCAGKWTHLLDFVSTPGFSDEVIGLFLATELTRGDGNPDDDEFLHLCKMPLEEAVAMVLRGEIDDGKTVAALLLAREKMNNA